MRQIILLACFLWSAPLFAQETFFPLPLPRLENYPRSQTGERPVVVLVHGMSAAPDNMHALARELYSRGYHTEIFHYDDSKSLDAISAEFRELAAPLFKGQKQARIIAHSMGGLVVRHALSEGQPEFLPGTKVRFLSIASPFGGFTAANAANTPMMRLFSVFMKRSYRDLGSESDFIKSQGRLQKNISHIKIETYERSQPSRQDVVNCSQQEHPTVDAGAARIETYAAGHLRVISDNNRILPALEARLTSYGFPIVGDARELTDTALSVAYQNMHCRDYASGRVSHPLATIDIAPDLILPAGEFPFAPSATSTSAQ